MEREQFTFYRSFFEAISDLSDEDQLAAYRAIAAYALNGETSDLAGAPSAVFKLIKPILDKAAKKAETGKNGGESKPQANDKQTASEAEANAKQNGSKREANGKQTVSKKEGEGEKEIEYEYTPPVSPSSGEPDLSDLPDGVQSAVRDWLAYKRERRESYKPTGLTAFLSAARQNTALFGEASVVGVIRSSMANGYRGVTWDRLGKQPNTRHKDAPKADKARADLDRWAEEFMREGAP